MNIKAMSIKEAAQHGYPVFRWAFSSFIPVGLPKEVATHEGLYEALLEQFDPRFEGDNDVREGRFTQMIQDTRGEAGLAGAKYIVVGDYSEQGGIEVWKAYGALEVK